ncbi:hypothetical protein [Acetobacter nitrogenifigens]|nr:hypothetical protein [Acetobacter nitrogenifigens]
MRGRIQDRIADARKILARGGPENRETVSAAQPVWRAAEDGALQSAP